MKMTLDGIEFRLNRGGGLYAHWVGPHRFDLWCYHDLDWVARCDLAGVFVLSELCSSAGSAMRSLKRSLSAMDVVGMQRYLTVEDYAELVAQHGTICEYIASQW